MASSGRMTATAEGEQWSHDHTQIFTPFFRFFTTPNTKATREGGLAFLPFRRTPRRRIDYL